jgi:predicted Zn-ribbon and HTH transcriptional regulator
VRGNNIKLTTLEFIKRAIKIHKDKYDYSKTDYQGMHKKVIIICKTCGYEFGIKPCDHIHQKHGCKYCNHRSYKYTTEEWIEGAERVHGKGRYNYIKIKEYKNNKTKIPIICNICGYEFPQRPNDHLSGSGCPVCKSKSKLENKIKLFLDSNNIKYIQQYTTGFLKGKSCPLSLDFYLPNYNIAIECQGKQHFEVIDYFGGDKTLYNTIKRDIRKNRLCCDNNLKVLYFLECKYNEKMLDVINDAIIFNKENELIKYIQ